MGYIRHNAIIATTWQEEAAAALSEYAVSIGAEAIASKAVTNGYRTVCIAPDGSKEGWEESTSGDKRRDAIKLWMTEHTDFYFEWCEVVYGNDDAEADVIDDAWHALPRR